MEVISQMKFYIPNVSSLCKTNQNLVILFILQIQIISLILDNHNKKEKTLINRFNLFYNLLVGVTMCSIINFVSIHIVYYLSALHIFNTKILFNIIK